MDVSVSIFEFEIFFIFNNRIVEMFRILNSHVPKIEF